MFRAVEWPLAKFIWMQIFLTEKIALEHNSFNLGHRKKSKGVPKSPPILKRGPSRCKCDHFCLVARVPFLLKTFPPLRLLLVIYEPVGKLSEMAFTPSMGGIFFSFNRFQFVHDQVVEEEKKSQDVDQSALFHLALSGAWLKQGPAIERPGN